MTSDLGDRPDATVATPGRWRIGTRRQSRATTVAPVDEDLTALALQRMLDNAENRILGTQAKVEAILAHLAHRHRWAGKTRDEALGDVKHELFELYLFVTGKAK